MGNGIMGNVSHQACQFRRGAWTLSGTVDWMPDGFGRGGATLCRPALLRPCLESVLVASYQHLTDAVTLAGLLFGRESGHQDTFLYCAIQCIDASQLSHSFGVCSNQTLSLIDFG
jgi:hypothetical protein